MRLLVEKGERPIEIEGKTLLVVGLGGSGTEVAKRAHGLAMHVIATRKNVTGWVIGPGDIYWNVKKSPGG